MNKNILLLLTFLLSIGLSKIDAQALRVTYTTTPGLANTDTIKIYMQSTTSNPIDISAVNFSFAYQGSCAVFQGFQSVFTDEWTTFLEQSDIDPSVSVAYNGYPMDRRLRYGNANPGLAFTNMVQVPSVTNPPLMVMALVFDGLCSNLIYMENEIENPVNQIASGSTFTRIPYAVSAINSPFPVEVLSFEGTIIDHETVQLDWKTANEKNNDYFLVEKSFDGVLFKTNPNARVKGAGNTTTETEYNYIDRGQMARTVYYRLKQVDFDGSYARSNVIEVHFPDLTPVFDLMVSVFPNPTTDHLFIEVNTQENNVYEIKVVDMTGRIHFQQETGFGPSFAHRKKISLADYPSGIYTIEVADLNDSGEAKSMRIIKK